MIFLNIWNVHLNKIDCNELVPKFNFWNIPTDLKDLRVEIMGFIHAYPPLLNLRTILTKNDYP